MLLRAWRLMTLVLAALSLTMESAHVLELPQKMQYDAQMYSAVNTTMYRYFAIVGGAYQVGSIVAAAVLVYLVRRRRPSFGWTLASALCLLLTFGIWLAVVAPVNGEVAAALRSQRCSPCRRSGCGCGSVGSMGTRRALWCNSSASVPSCSWSWWRRRRSRCVMAQREQRMIRTKPDSSRRGRTRLHGSPA